MAQTIGNAGKPGADDQVSESNNGADRSTRSLAVGDRVWIYFSEKHEWGNQYGVITDKAWGLSYYHWMVRPDGATYDVPFAVQEISLAMLPEPWDGWNAVDEIEKSWSVRIDDACEELAELLKAKRAGYGSAAIDDSPWGWEIAILTRTHEKQERAINVATGNDGAQDTYDPDELAESFKDLAGVAILGWVKAMEA